MPYHYELLTQPSQLEQAPWDEMQQLAWDAVRFNLSPSDRRDAEVDAYVGMNDPERFARSRIDPNTEVGGNNWPDDGKLFRPGQEFRNPRLAIASKNGTIVGYATGADNVSGNSQELIDLKWRYPRAAAAKWFMLREVMVTPNLQGKGLGPKLGRTLLKGIMPTRPVSAYTYPEELEHTFKPLRNARFHYPDEEGKPVHVFGADAEPAKQYRMVSSSAGAARLDSWVMSTRRTRHFKREGHTELA